MSINNIPKEAIIVPVKEKNNADVNRHKTTPKTKTITAGAAIIA